MNCASGSRLDQIGGQGVENILKSFAELEFFFCAGMGAVNLAIGLREQWNSGAEKIEIEEFRSPSVIEVSGVVCDFVDPVDQLSFERRAKIEKILGKLGAGARFVIP